MILFTFYTPLHLSHLAPSFRKSIICFSERGRLTSLRGSLKWHICDILTKKSEQSTGFYVKGKRPIRCFKILFLLPGVLPGVLPRCPAPSSRSRPYLRPHASHSYILCCNSCMSYSFFLRQPDKSWGYWLFLFCDIVFLKNFHK